MPLSIPGWLRTASLVLGTFWFSAGATHVAAENAPVGDPELGFDLAGRLCSGCHIVHPRQAGTAIDNVPTFTDIGARLGPDAIDSVLIQPSHPAMPVPPLTAQERAHVLAYLRSLAVP